MPRDIRETWHFSLNISSRIDYSASEQPRSTGDLKERADRFANRCREILSDQFAGEIEVSTEFVALGSAYTGHAASMHLESREEWERACRVFSEFTDDWEDIFADQWVTQEFLARRQVSVRLESRFDKQPQRDAPRAPTAGADDELRRAQKRVKKAMKSERKRMRRLLFNMAWAALAFGVVATAAALGFWFLSQEVQLLRTEIAARSAPMPPAAASPNSQVVVVYPSGQVRVAQPERQTRTYSSRP